MAHIHVRYTYKYKIIIQHIMSAYQSLDHSYHHSKVVQIYMYKVEKASRIPTLVGGLQIL